MFQTGLLVHTNTACNHHSLQMSRPDASHSSTKSILIPTLVFILGILVENNWKVFNHYTGPTVTRGTVGIREITSVERTYFYVGGRYENASQYGIGNGMIMTGQMYVESLLPAQLRHKWPIVMIAGGAQTGTNFLNTPDGRPGWAQYLVNLGYHVYIVDQVARGRSGWLSGFNPAQKSTMVDTDLYAQRWTAVHRFQLWEQAKYYTQWPGTTGLPGDPVFDAFYASQVPWLTNFTYSEEINQRAGLALLEKIGPSVLLTHSQSSLYAWGIAEAAKSSGLVKGIIALEPNGPPFVDGVSLGSKGITRPYGLTAVPLTYDPPLSFPSDLQPTEVPAPAGSNGTMSSCLQQGTTHSGSPRKLLHFEGIPTLLVTGQASYHSEYDYCTVQYLEEAGVDVKWFDLPKMGIFGNGHFMFMEKNSDLIMSKVENWLIDSIYR